MKELIIHLDGVDKVGKDAIKKELVKVSNGKFLVVVRSFLSQIVYSKIYKREIDSHFFINKMKKLAKDEDYYFFYLKATEDVLKKRFKKHNEKDLKEEDIKYHIATFNDIVDYINTSNFWKIKINIIDTSNKTVKQAVKEIIKICSNE